MLPQSRADVPPSAPLLGSREEATKPKLTMTFSLIQILRFPVFVLSLVDGFFIVHWRGHENAIWGLIYGSWALALAVWSVLVSVKSLGRKNGRFEIELGGYVCMLGRSRGNSDSSPASKSRPYPIIIGDVIFGAMFIVTAVVADKSYIWSWFWQKNILPLSITVTALQFVIAGMGFSTLCRRAKVTIYAAESDDAMDSEPISEYRDIESEPRHSTSSLV